MAKKRIELDKDEADILADFEKGEFQSVNNLDEEMQLAKEAAKNYLKRDSRINIRISKADLGMIRRIAAQEGLPYQTLLASVIHKFAAGRLADKNKNDEAA